jgi:hypothetical protein
MQQSKKPVVETAPPVSGDRGSGASPSTASVAPRSGSQEFKALDVPATQEGAELARAQVKTPAAAKVDPRTAWHAGTGSKLAEAKESNFSGADISAQDNERIQAALSRARDLVGDKAFLLHLGVGVGNPGAAFGNPSADRLMKAGNEAADPKAQSQREPGYLKQAAERGLVAVVLNFNASDSQGDPSGVTLVKHQPNLIRLDVDARFPLTVHKQGNSGQAHGAIEGLAQGARHVTVLNAVSPHYYPGIKSLVDSQSSQRLFKRDVVAGGGDPSARHMRTSYVESYLEEDRTQAYSMLPGPGGKGPFVTRTDAGKASVLDDWGDVFPTVGRAVNPPTLDD